MGEGGGLAGVGWRDGEKRHTTVIENCNKKLKLKKKKKMWPKEQKYLGLESAHSQQCFIDPRFLMAAHLNCYVPMATFHL